MTTITALPTAPSRSDTANFASRADAWITAFTGTTVNEINTVASEVNTNAATATTQAALATTNGAAQVTLAAAQVTLAAAQVTLATTQANNAANSATAAASSALLAGATVWVSGTTYAVGDPRYSPINLQTYRRKTAGAGTTDPSADSTNWTLSTDLPSQTGNAGKFVTTNGTTASWAFAGISQVTTATTATTLTSTPTLLQITPTSYGVTVTLPDATTCSVGGPLHCIDNRGAYPVRVCNTSGTLLGFVFAGVVSYIALDDKSTAAGVWAISNNELVGASAQLLTTNMALIDAVIDIGSSQEVIIGRGVSSANCYGVVYNRATNTFGSVTLIRTATFGSSLIAACSSGTNQVLVVSTPTGAATFEAVTLSISGTTITVNTAATATISSAVTAFADGCGLIAVGASFVTSYKVTTSTLNEYRAMTISGTTVTIGAATVCQNGGAGTGNALIAAAAGSIFIAAALTDSANLYITPYTVSGTTITIGTGATAVSTGAGNTLQKFFPLGTRWCAIDNDNSSARVRCTIASLSATTITVSSANAFTASTLQDAIVVGSNKVLVLNAATTNNANIITDTSGTASAGTAITLSSGVTRACLYVSGTDVFVAERTATDDIAICNVSCSGASPVLTLRYPVVGNITATSDYICAASDSVLRKSPRKVTGSGFSQAITYGSYTSQITLPRVRGGIPSLIPSMSLNYVGTPANAYRGINESQVWQTNVSTAIVKVECVA